MSYHLPLHSRWPQRVESAPLLSKAAPSHGLRPALASIGGSGTSRVLEGVKPGNLTLQSDGLTRIALANDWEAMLHDLTGLGTLLVMTRNEAAVIARYMSYPEVAFDLHSPNAEDAEGEFHYDLNWWHSAYARHSLLPKGNGYAVEFLDRHRQAFHSVVLTPDSDSERFNRWLRQHQAATPPGAVFPVPAYGRSRPSDATRQLHRSRLLPLLQEIRDAELPIRAAVGHEAVLQQHTFRIRNVRPSGSWVFASDDETGLHIDLEGIANLTLSPLLMDGKEGVAIRAYHANGRLLFYIAPAHACHLSQWGTLPTLN